MLLLYNYLLISFHLKFLHFCIILFINNTQIDYNKLSVGKSNLYTLNVNNY